MKTERDIIYMIWEVVRAGRINQDDPINERLMRAFLSAHRGKHLSRAFSNGDRIPDECFQYLGSLSFTKLPTEEIYILKKFPKTVRFNSYNTGLFAKKDGMNIPIVGAEAFDLMKFHEWNKHHPAISHLGYGMRLRTGVVDDCECPFGDASSELNTLYQTFEEDAKKNTTEIQFNAVLVDPSDAIDYNWKEDPYPFPDEIVEDLINSVNAREFNLFLKIKGEDVTNNTNEDPISQQGDV